MKTKIFLFFLLLVLTASFIYANENPDTIGVVSNDFSKIWKIKKTTDQSCLYEKGRTTVVTIENFDTLQVFKISPEAKEIIKKFDTPVSYNFANLLVKDGEYLVDTDSIVPKLSRIIGKDTVVYTRLIVKKEKGEIETFYLRYLKYYELRNFSIILGFIIFVIAVFLVLVMNLDPENSFKEENEENRKGIRVLLIIFFLLALILSFLLKEYSLITTFDCLFFPSIVFLPPLLLSLLLKRFKKIKKMNPG